MRPRALPRPRGTALLAAIGALAASAAAAQVPPFAGDVPVNTFTTSLQSYPAIATRGDGSFVVVWETSDASFSGISGQRYDFLGGAAGGEFQANTYTTDLQYATSIAETGGGSFVVVWTSFGQDGSAHGVFGQRFDASGAKVGAEFLVNTFTTQYQGYPRVAAGPAGDFVVVWSSYGQDGSAHGVFGQRFDENGTKLGPEFPVNTYTTGRQNGAAVAMSREGTFVVVWRSENQDGSGEGVFGQRFDASGAKVGGEFPVNTETSGDQRAPSVAVDRGGNFVVAWTDIGAATNGGDVLAQRFDASAGRVGLPFRVNSYSTGLQDSPDVAIDADGNFTVVWRSAAQDGSLSGVFAQQFDRRGGSIAGEFQVNVFTTGGQKLPRVIDDGAGLVVTWASDGQDGSGYGVFARRQRLHPEGLAVDPPNGRLTASDQNGVLEPDETVFFEPEWSNVVDDFVALSGTATVPLCPIGTPCLFPVDAAADYGSMPPNSAASCDDGSPDECYLVRAAGLRPGVHWDGSLSENLSGGGGHAWTVHVGDSFADVPRSQPFYRKIETMLHHGITLGCGGANYCPSTVVSRDQMAIFIAKGLAGAGELVPVSGSVAANAYDCRAGGVSLFSDVAPTASECRHVHLLAARNVTLGCSPTQYCPSQPVTRDAMASFIAKAIVAPGGGAAVPQTYGPDPATGRSYSCAAGSPDLHFSDVGTASPFCKHVHFLWAKGIVDGCSATQYCPAATVARDAMAKFIGNAFGLQLYAP